MSLIRTALMIGAAVYLLPVEEKRQASFSATAAKAAAETATFCERNVHTCGAGRELGSLLLHKAEYGVELGARLVREQFLSGSSSESQQAAAPASPLYLAPQSPGGPPYRRETAANPFRAEQASPRRADYPTDHPPRWR